MKSTTEDSPSLHYYDSLDALEAAGDTCVGMLYKYSGCTTAASSLLSSEAYIKVKSDANIGKNVYMLTGSSKIWTVGQLDKAKVANELGKEQSELTLEDYGTYSKNHPDILETEAPAHSYNISENYRKAAYNDSGYQGGETGGRFQGDSLYIVPYKTTISKSVAQKSGNDVKRTYDMDANQRYADYVLAGTLTYEQGVTVENPDRTTTVTITDLLPAGLTYVEGSAYMGGTYEEQEQKPGKVTGGRALEPAVEENSDGTSTLTWEIENEKAGETRQMEPIYYSCLIGDPENPSLDVKDSQMLENEVKISTTEDHRFFQEYNGNIAKASININRKSSFNFYKEGDNHIEQNGEGTFILHYNNSSSSDMAKIFTLDTMPYDGQKVGSQTTVMKGNYKLTTVRIDADKIGDLSDIKIYYTNNEEYREKSAQDVTIDEIQTSPDWTLCTVDDKGNISGLNDKWPAAIAIYNDKLEGMKSLKVTMNFKGDLGAVGDHLVNMYSFETLCSYGTADVYGRLLDGIAWIDQNYNGGYEEGEELLKDIEVQLWKVKLGENGDPVKDQDGKLVYEKVKTTKTDKNGYYSFGIQKDDETPDVKDLLEAGDYKVIFLPSENIGVYDVTEKEKAKIDDSVNSKVSGEYEDDSDILKDAVIQDIHMKTIDEMKEEGTSFHHLPYQNAGFVKFSRSISGTTWFDQDKNGEINKGDKTSDELLNDITVQLWKETTSDTGEKVYEQVKGKDGKPVTTTTKKGGPNDENGYYEFTGLEPGTYKVVFEKDTDLTKKEAVGVDTSVNSKASASDDKKTVFIEGINLPTDDELAKGDTYKPDENGCYEVPYQNAGFIWNPVKDETKPGNGIHVVEKDEIVYTITYKNYKSYAADVVVTDNLDAKVEIVSQKADDKVIFDKDEISDPQSVHIQ